VLVDAFIGLMFHRREMRELARLVAATLRRWAMIFSIYFSVLKIK
jgi:uncharacterized membrane protein